MVSHLRSYGRNGDGMGCRGPSRSHCPLSITGGAVGLGTGLVGEAAGGGGLRCRDPAPSRVRRPFVEVGKVGGDSVIACRGYQEMELVPLPQDDRR